MMGKYTRGPIRNLLKANTNGVDCVCLPEWGSLASVRPNTEVITEHGPWRSNPSVLYSTLRCSRGDDYLQLSVSALSLGSCVKITCQQPHTFITSATVDTTRKWRIKKRDMGSAVQRSTPSGQRWVWIYQWAHDSALESLSLIVCLLLVRGW